MKCLNQSQEVPGFMELFCWNLSYLTGFLFVCFLFYFGFWWMESFHFPTLKQETLFKKMFTEHLSCASEGHGHLKLNRAGTILPSVDSHSCSWELVVQKIWWKVICPTLLKRCLWESECFREWTCHFGREFLCAFRIKLMEHEDHSLVLGVTTNNTQNMLLLLICSWKSKILY